MIYIAAHKEFEVPSLQGYIPLQVGAEGKKSLGYLKDNEGKEISAKNPNFCELTGLYWIWKNTQDDLVGLVHYRRYFGKSNFSADPKDIYSYDEMKQMLKDVDIILPYTAYFLQNAKEEILVECCTEEIFDQLRECVLRLYPDYIQDFDRFFAANQSSLFNMMFCRRAQFDAYCQWLFDILFELEKYVDLEKLNDYQKRLFGFLSERLLNIWVMHHHLRVRHVAVVNIGMPLNTRITIMRRRLTNRIRYRLKGQK